LPTVDVVLPLDRFVAERAQLADHPARIGVRLDSADDVRRLDGLLDGVDLILLHFPRFADGRPYSLARILREQLGYRGALRATGDVLRDQLRTMWRCGFDEFAVREDKDARDALRALAGVRADYGVMQGLRSREALTPQPPLPYEGRGGGPHPPAPSPL